MRDGWGALGDRAGPWGEGRPSCWGRGGWALDFRSAGHVLHSPQLARLHTCRPLRLGSLPLPPAPAPYLSHCVWSTRCWPGGVSSWARPAARWAQPHPPDVPAPGGGGTSALWEPGNAAAAFLWVLQGPAWSPLQGPLACCLLTWASGCLSPSCSWAAPASPRCPLLSLPLLSGLCLFLRPAVTDC